MRWPAALLLCLVTTTTHAETGIASIYANNDGHAWTKTANCYRNAKRQTECERVDPGKLTAAHRTLPFGTMVKVTNLKNGRTVTVRINDRGPWKPGRIIDVMPAAAQKLDFDGLAPVRIVAL